MNIYLCICIILALAYAMLILVYAYGWLQIPVSKAATSLNPVKGYSILIPARNEAAGIEACLASVAAQDFSAAHFEIILIDDGSTDQTVALAQKVMQNYEHIAFRVLSSDTAKFSGKKAGISMGVDMAVHEYIVLTDADCTRGKQWLKAIATVAEQESPNMIYAPVFFSGSNLFERFQSLEFAGLVGIGGAAIQLKNPNMCSAANLVFRKNVFLEVGGYASNEHIASGDDEFLLHKVFKYNSNKVLFLKSREALVYTNPNATLDQLAQQRRRWVSKSTKYENRYITAILAGAWFFNLSILLNLALAWWWPLLGITGAIQLSLKMLAEGILLGSILRFFKRMDLLLLVPAVQIFHMLYVVIIGVWANVQTYTWKERELK